MKTPVALDASHPAPRRGAWVSVAMWMLAAALLRALLSRFVPLLPDETYY